MIGYIHCTHMFIAASNVSVKKENWQKVAEQTIRGVPEIAISNHVTHVNPFMSEKFICINQRCTQRKNVVEFNFF